MGRAHPIETKAEPPQEQEVWGGLAGTETGSAFGVGGLGLIGTGRGGGGVGAGVGAGPIVGQIATHGFIGPMRLDPTVARSRAGTVGRYLEEQGFVLTASDPRSTFSIDVDTASYSAMRRSLEGGALPSAEDVRIEELVNYFDYEYAQPTGDAPFSVQTEVGPAPFSPGHLLVHVGLQGKAIAPEDVPPRNLVFLVDVSGSMTAFDKLPLVRRSLAQLTDTLRAEDRISLVVYAGMAGLVLPPTSGADKDVIHRAIDQLDAGGSTNGGAGIQLAYAQARAAEMKNGVNRVILATDGDFNVGVASHEELVALVEKERESGVELSVLGYGIGHRDHTMEQLADKGNGNYAYIDGPREATKVLVEEAGGTLVTIAKDVKIQVEIDPSRVWSHRLVGYDNRRLQHEDFADDTKDAGEIGAGHSVTALYDVVPRTDGDPEAPWMTVSIRYKNPKGKRSARLEVPVVGTAESLDETSDDFRFSAAVAAFGMLLRGSEYGGTATFGDVQQLALEASGEDLSCRRHELAELVADAARLAGEDAGLRDVPACSRGTEDAPKVEPPTPSEPAEVVHVEHVDELVPEPAPAPVRDDSAGAWALEVLRLLPPLLALPLFVMALRRPRRRD
jgi:Ca-activated chloride channel family protein